MKNLLIVSFIVVAILGMTVDASHAQDTTIVRMISDLTKNTQSALAKRDAKIAQLKKQNAELQAKVERNGGLLSGTLLAVGHGFAMDPGDFCTVEEMLKAIVADENPMPLVRAGKRHAAEFSTAKTNIGENAKAIADLKGQVSKNWAREILDITPTQAEIDAATALLK